MNAKRNPESIILETRDGISISLCASLTSISTYVLLEQEQWFEKELAFLTRWLTTGMNAVDIGANVGVYSLPLAKCVTSAGQVFAFEPGAANRRNLETGRIANKLGNLHVSACALADSAKQGWLEIARASEMNALVIDPSSSAAVEKVRVSTLDIEERKQSWPSIDFVKIDAEGHEAHIVAGGRHFFASHSPVVMYEVMSEHIKMSNVRWAFEALGYATYRLLGDASCLVPVGSDEPGDSDHLNLFAVKRERAKSLAASGHLVLARENIGLDAQERAVAIKCLLELPYARHFEFTAEEIFGCDYGEALVLFAAYRFAALSPTRKFAALGAAFAKMSEYCRDNSSATSLVTMSRIAQALGYRRAGFDALLQLLEREEGEILQPFFPACERFETIAPAGREAEWFVAAAMEQAELSRAHSSLFATSATDYLRHLCNGPFASAEMCRRMILKSAYEGVTLSNLTPYLRSEHRHRNSEYWTATGLSRILAWA